MNMCEADFSAEVCEKVFTSVYVYVQHKPDYKDIIWQIVGSVESVVSLSTVSGEFTYMYALRAYNN